MSRSRRRRGWLSLRSSTADVDAWLALRSLPPVTYQRLRDVAIPPLNECIRPGELYRVVTGGKPRWALFACPCGCLSVVTLSLQRVHHPHWAIRETEARRPSIRPSVWRDVGCLSHFLVEDGRVYWVSDIDSQS
jgi:hypothetical protein